MKILTRETFEAHVEALRLDVVTMEIIKEDALAKFLEIYDNPKLAGSDKGKAYCTAAHDLYMKELKEWETLSAVYEEVSSYYLDFFCAEDRLTDNATGETFDVVTMEFDDVEDAL